MLLSTPISAKTGGSCISLSIISFNLCRHVLHTPELRSRRITVTPGCNLLLTHRMRTKSYLTQLVQVNQFCVVLPLIHSFPTLFPPLATVLCLYHGRKFLPEPCIWCFDPLLQPNPSFVRWLGHIVMVRKLSLLLNFPARHKISSTSSSGPVNL